MTTKHEVRDGPPASASAAYSSAQQLNQFCAGVLADVSLHERLREPADTDRFIALILATARARGFDFVAEQVAEAMRRRLPPGPRGVTGGDPHRTPSPPAGWLPIQAAWQHGELYIDWAYFGDGRLSGPFFDGDVRRALNKPFNRLFRYATPIAELGGWLQEHPALQPSGFIFHMSRCGSTLVSRMLAALPQNTVISEASPIDMVVRADHVEPTISLDQQAQWLRWMIGALGVKRGGDSRNYIIKLDCWHTLALPLFRRAFPDVPWIFLYRDPVEVLVSHRAMPGMQMIPSMLGSNLFGIDPAENLRDPDGYRAQVLARICEPIVQQYSKGHALLVNYKDLPHALWTTIMPHFGIACSESDRAELAAAAQYDAKTPGLEFAPDVESKQRNATPAIRAAAGRRLGELCRQLEAIRLNA